MQYAQCSVQDGKTVAGSDTEEFTSYWEPHSDSTLRGLFTNTVLTSECGHQGLVRQTPFVATQIGDVPPGISVADPGTIANAPTTNTSAPAVPGPVLDGTYRLDYDYAKTTVNGVLHPSDNSLDWWAFRSLCTTAGCVATGTRLDDANHQEAAGFPKVLQFDNGHWHDVPLTLRISCAHSGTWPSGTAPPPTDQNTVSSSWSWEPQPDGALKGVDTLKIETDECRLGGQVGVTPLVATRIGDVPSSVVLADPALFAS